MKSGVFVPLSPDFGIRKPTQGYDPYNSVQPRPCVWVFEPVKVERQRELPEFMRRQAE